MPRPVTEVERICVSFRDQSADWSWESVIPLLQGRGERIATASVRTGFAMTGFFQGERCKSGWAGRCGHRPLRRVTRSAVQGRAAGGVEPRPYGEGKGCGGAGRCRHRPLRRGYKECGSWQASARGAPTEWIVGADDSVRPVHSFFRLGATHIKKALCYDAGIIAKGFFILDCAYLTSSMMAVSAASPRRTPVRTMRV